MQHWWNAFEPSFMVRIEPPHTKQEHVGPEQKSWLAYLKSSRDEGDPMPKIVLQPIVFGEHPQQVALDMLGETRKFLVAFDVCKLGGKDGKDKIAKGYLPLPSAEIFYNHVHLRVAPKCRTFYQVMLPDLSCAWHFDVDGKAKGDTSLDIAYFLQALFEEISNELEGKFTAEQLWDETLLLDAGCNVLGDPPQTVSCHGVCHPLVFPDNHTSMKTFAHRVHARLDQRADCKKLMVWHPKKKTWVLPLDKSIYSHYRPFRIAESSKMTANDKDRRPLVVATYNRCRRTSFLDTIVPQGTLVTAPEIIVAQEEKFLVKKRLPLARQEGDASPEKRPKSSALVEHLLRQVKEWGNSEATVSKIDAAKRQRCIYVSFANATKAHNHTHKTNNIFAIVDPARLQIQWHCQRGSQKSCPMHTTPLPLKIAME